MHQSSRHLAAIALIALFTLGITAGTSEEKEAPKNPLLGTWELIKIKYGAATDFTDFPKERRRLKLITDTHWSWVEYDTAGPKEAKVGAGGPYTLKDDTYTETIEFATGPMSAYLDKKHAFKIKLDGDKCHVSGELADGLKIEDIWQRVK